ncbi:DMT family transporter [Jongsikchunia kroppenstedtii]|uniref:DMT family transporter n=1 Tax=Jongsikchunia kroppenstedtii TaxID=1121721 RepID=UPI0012DFA3D2|nr:DMT family transporter [Jongsikchunia kroppenstedtii]
MKKLSLPLGASTAFFYALGYPVGALAVRAATPGVILLARFGISALILVAIVVSRRLEWPRGRQAWHAVVVGLLTQGVQFVGCYEAMYCGVSPVLVALVIAMNPVITAAIATGMLGERLSARRVLAVGLAMIAVCVAFAGRVAAVGHVEVAIVWVIVAVIGLALGGVYQQRYLNQGHPLAINAIGVSVALVPAGIFTAVTPQHVVNVAHTVTWVGVMVITSSVIGASLYFTVIRQAGAAAAALLFGVIPSIAALLTWAMLGQRPDIGVVIGLVIGAAACLIGAGAGRPVGRPASLSEPTQAVPGQLVHQMRTRSVGSRYSASPGCTSNAS